MNRRSFIRALAAIAAAPYVARAAPILPTHYGRVRAPGFVIWASDLKETTYLAGGIGGGGATYEYSASFVIGPRHAIQNVTRIWADRKLVWTFDEEKEAWARVITPEEAKRSHAMIVCKDVNLSEYGNRFPNITIEGE